MTYFLKSLYEVKKSLINNFKKNNLWFYLTLILLIIFIITIIVNAYKPVKEGFLFQKKFVENKDDGIFDDFYVSIYDDLVYNEFKNDYEIGEIINNTSPTSKSVILDLGSGTGHHVDLLQSKGYNVIGVDKSTYMIEKSKENYPNSTFILGDFMKPMSFESNEFTHITCFYFTIYYIKDKLSLFNNIYSWLKPGGYFIIHLVENDLFDPIIPAGNPFAIVSPQNYAKKRITTSNIVFDNFTYKSIFDYKYPHQENGSIFPNDFKIFMEIFKDKKTGNVRQNKHNFYMETPNKILDKLKSVGFIETAQINMQNCKYDYQYLYVFLKPS